MKFFPKLLKNKFIYLMIPSLVLISACGGSNNEQNDDSTHKNLDSVKLLPPENDEIYFGAFTNYNGLEDGVSAETIANFDELTQKPIAWSFFANNWSKTDWSATDPLELYTPEIKYPKENIRTVHNAGKTPFIRLLPWTSPHIIVNPSDLARSSNGSELTSVCVESDNFPQYETRLIATSELISKLDDGATTGPCFNDYTMQSIIDGEWDENLRQWAQDSNNDLDDDGNVIPLLITFTVEMEGNWFPWSGIFNGGAIKDQYGDKDLADGPERYRDAYRHIIDLFNEEGVKHVTWFFSPMIISPKETWMAFYSEDWNHPKNYYPGDDYIDWVGATIYGPSVISRPTDLFSTKVAEKHHLIHEVTQNKPIALLEFGAFERNIDPGKTAWLNDAFDTILNSEDLKFDAITYWNASFESDDGSAFYDLRVNSADDSLLTFKELISNPRFVSELQFTQ